MARKNTLPANVHYVGGELWLIADFAQAACPILCAFSRADVNACLAGESELEFGIRNTPFQVADTQHSRSLAAQLVRHYLRSNGN